MSLNNFFNPKAAAVIGASSQKHKLGRQILDNIIKSKFKGKIYPINLKNKKIAKLPTYVSISDLPISKFNSLLVVVAIPAKFVIAEIEKCASLGVKNIIIISAGFKEDGPEGKKLEARLVQIAKKHNINILGPNCLGFINTYNNLNATFTQADNRIGNIALLSQSGAVGSATLDWLKQRNINLGYFLSLGNKAVINENDVLEYLAKDSKIDLIALYLEEIEDGQKFMSLVSRLSKKKPVVVLKAGQSAEGGKLALSHTGSLAGSNKVVETGLMRAGAIYLNNLEELLNLCLLTKKSQWQQQKTAELNLVTNAGGLAVLTADAISRQGLRLKDSIDILGDAPASRYKKTIEELLAKREVDNILVLLTPQTSTEPLKTAQAIVKLSKKYPKKLIMASFSGGDLVNEAKAFLVNHQIPTFDFPAEAVCSFKQLVNYRERKLKLKTYPAVVARAKRIIKDIDYLKSLLLLKRYGIDIVKTNKLNPQTVKSLKYPVVVKIVGPDFIHKSDKKAVVLGIENKKDLNKAIKSLQRNHKRELLNTNNYLVVQKEIKDAQEIILGIKRDDSFGSLVLIGLGGIYAEVFKEVKMEISDLDLKRAKEIIRGLKIYPILNGARKQRKYDITALAKALVSLARVANEHPEVKELDINPLFIKEKGVLAGDVRIIV